jgi:hypothetical protein
MLAPEAIRRRAQSRYADYLRSLTDGTVFFPLPVRFGKPSPTEDFEKLRREINALTEANLGCQIEWVEINSRRWGKQRLPERVTFADENSYLRTLGKAKEAARFHENLALTRERCAALVPFLQERPLEVVEFAESWPGLLEVCCYLQLHPRPDLYARELPLSVDTKFFERHKSVLGRLLPLALPPTSIMESERFEERFGLRYDEPQIRFRLLDETLQSKLGIPFPDFALTLNVVRALRWRYLRVVIVENKMPFLTLPLSPNTIAIWGQGNAAALLHSVVWLRDCELFYWGDLDVQGLDILSRLRGAFPAVQSLMMDERTLKNCYALCHKGPPANVTLPPNLTESEKAAWDEIKTGNLRIEQERIPVADVCSAILKRVSGEQ